MRTSIRLSLLLACPALLAACATTGLSHLAPGQSSEAQVRQALGEPARVFDLPDGSRQLVFPKGPEGVRTYMAFVSPAGRLDRVEQALTEERFRRIARGASTRADVERLIGPPWRVMDFPNKRQVSWDYVFQDSWGYTVDFSVMFDERGLVAELASVRRDFGDGGMH